MKGQRRRVYALLMAIFMLVTTVAGSGMNLTVYAEENTENDAGNSAEEDETEEPEATREEPEASLEDPFKDVDTGTLITSADALKTAAEEGKKIALYSAAANQVLTATVSGKALAGAEAALSEDTLIVPDEAVRMNVTVDESEETDAYSFSYTNGKKTFYLTSGATGNALSFEETANEYSWWNLSAADSAGSWFIDNANAVYNGSVQSLEYYKAFTTFGKKTTDIYKFQLYAVDEAAAGYVIYNPEYKKALSSIPTGSFLTGADLEADFTTVQDTEVWKISNAEEEGQVRIASFKDGQKLSMAAEKSYLLLDGVNDTWTLEKQADDTYYIVNVVRRAAGNNHTIEWYASNNNFSTYNPSANNQDVNLYKMALIPVTRSQIEITSTEPEEPEDPITGTKTCVIYNPANEVALSSVYNGNYNSGVAMASGFTEVMDTEVWEINTHESGKISITSYAKGQNLSMSDSFTSTPLGEKYDKWELKEQEDGLYYIVNVGRAGSTLEYQVDRGTYSAYHTIAEGSEGLFKMQFIEVGGDTGITIKETPKETHVKTIDNGDYCLYSSTAEGVMCYILTGGAANKVAAAPTEDGKVDFGEGDGTGAAVFTLEWVADKEAYLIKCGDEYLSLNTSVAKELYRSASIMETTKNGSYWYIDKNEEFDGYTIKNKTATAGGAEVYLEYYPSSGFCGYTVGKGGLTEIYVFDFLDASDIENNGGHVGEKPVAKAPLEEGTYVIYNESGASIVGGPADIIDGSAATLSACVTTKDENGAYSLGNGGLIFNVTKNGDYYLFENKGKYMATNTDEEMLLVTKEEGDANKNIGYEWAVVPTEDGLGYILRSSSITWGSSSIVVEYFSGGFCGYTFKAGQPEMFTFDFIPCEDTYGFGYVVNPRVTFNSLAEANQDVDFDATFTLDDMGTPSAVTAQVKFEDGATKTYTPAMDQAKEEGEVVKTGKVTVPKADLVGHEKLDLTVSATSEMEGNVKVPYSGTRTVNIHDEPMILAVSPAPNSGTGTDKQPKISVTYANIGEDAEVILNFNGDEGLTMQNDAAAKTYSYTPGTALEDNKYTAEVTITRKDGKKVTRSWSFYIGEVGYKVKFGQIHAHTAEYSDGSGTLENAYEHAMSAADDMDYLIVTDHSNYFDTTATATKESIYDAASDSILAGTGAYPEADASKSLNLWQEAKATAAYYDNQNPDFVAAYGYEMTWSGGPGHINVFNSEGIVSRNNDELNNKTNDAGMLAFYDLVVDADTKGDTSTGEGNISAQFNHPGTTFGFFNSFTGWTAERDQVMNLIEVGNGDGTVGGTGYYPSYEYYDMCLTVGWHVAPTNGQDNHKGGWGSINPTRTVALTENFSENGIYEAMNQRRIYSTEDQNLTLIYTLDDYPQGSIIENYDKDTVTLNVSLSDEDQESMGKVYVIGENGKVLNEKTPEEVSGNTAELEITLDNTSPYYYIKVVQADGDIAVSAPIWVGEVGATRSNVKAVVDAAGEDGNAPVEKQAATIQSTLTNGEESAITVVSYSITVDGEALGDAQTVNKSVAAGEAYDISCSWTPAKYGSHQVAVNFIVKADGEERNVVASKKVYVQGENYNTVSPISATKSADEREEFTVEGIITANTSGYDKNTAFFDCTYVQDETGGINIFPLSGNYQVGQKVRVHGGITYYCGEIELNLSEDYGGYVEILDETPNPVAPTKVSSKDAMADKNVGLLMEVSGTVSRIHEASGVIDRIYVNDGSGQDACVYINGYIWNSATENFDDFGTEGTTVKVGDKVTAIGIGSIDEDELHEVPLLHRLRVRDRAEINVVTESGPVKADKTALNSLIAEADKKVQSDYTAESWTVFADALANAKAAAGKEDATQEEVDNAKAALQAAMDKLVKKGSTTVVTVDKAALSAAIAQANALSKSKYTAASWTVFANALAAANKVNSDANATQAQVNSALATLNNAKDALKLAVTKVTIVNGKKIEMAAGKKITLSVAVTPAGASKSVTWSLDKASKKYASISKKGVLTAKKTAAGRTLKVTATAADGSKKKATVAVKVMKKPVSKITLKANKKSVKAGKKVTIKATVKPSTASKSVTWSLDKKSVKNKYATINSKGVLTTKKAGKGKTVTVTATANDGSKKKATIKIKITK